ncbi:G-protein coupled receptor 4-like [Triplophysa dalaica]|uniref:G-protein coupled receptor 4-like n=1 Tax=Triplophysa dalaica TaxID=1582913 RepID=UPI0024DF5E82|nr:G-protein coupled receptor 4-like [Triplophysa dalaica]
MNNSTVNLNITESPTNSLTHFLGLMSPPHICFLCINVLLGLPAHSYVIWLIIGSESRIKSDFFILTLSFCEIGICLSWLLDVLSIWFLNLMELVFFSKGLIITGRPLFQCLICVERYLAVVHPVTFLKYKPLRYRLMCSAVTWIMSFGSCLCSMFILNLSAYDNFIWFISVQLIVFLSIQFFCCLAVLRALKQSGPGERGREREENHMKRKAFYLILITTVSMLIAYIPSIFVGLFILLAEQFLPEPFLTGFVCFVLAGYVHPVLYFHRTGKLCCLSSS